MRQGVYRKMDAPYTVFYCEWYNINDTTLLSDVIHHLSTDKKTTGHSPITKEKEGRK